MSTHAHDHEPFDREEWAASLPPGHEIELTAPTPSILNLAEVDGTIALGPDVGPAVEPVTTRK